MLVTNLQRKVLKMMDRIKIAFNVLTGKGGEDMATAVVLAMNIADDIMDFKNVPKRLRPMVKQQLEMMGLGELAVL